MQRAHRLQVHLPQEQYLHLQHQDQGRADEDQVHRLTVLHGGYARLRVRLGGCAQRRGQLLRLFVMRACVAVIGSGKKELGLWMKMGRMGSVVLFYSDHSIKSIQGDADEKIS